MRLGGIAALLLVAASIASPQIIPTGSLDNGGPGAAGPLLTAAPALPVGDVTFVSPTALELEVGPDMTAATYIQVEAKDNVAALGFYVSLKRSADQAPCSGTVATLSGATAI